MMTDYDQSTYSFMINMTCNNNYGGPLNYYVCSLGYFKVTGWSQCDSRKTCWLSAHHVKVVRLPWRLVVDPTRLHQQLSPVGVTLEDPIGGLALHGVKRPERGITNTSADFQRTQRNPRRKDPPQMWFTSSIIDHMLPRSSERKTAASE